MNARNILIALVLKYKGNWDKIMKAVAKKEYPGDKYLEQSQNLSCKTVTLLDAEYPNTLRSIVKPAFVLFYYGNLEILNDLGKVIGIEGDRECSDYGINKTKELTKALSEKEYIIASGAHEGIEAFVHRSVLEANGKGVLVLANGIENTSENKEIYEKAKASDNYLILSEMPGTIKKPTKIHAISRNRILAGLCNSLVFTEMHKKSDIMSIALFALNGTNADIMCVPNKADLESGCNNLIANGAALVENVTDIIDNITTY